MFLKPLVFDNYDLSYTEEVEVEHIVFDGLEYIKNKSGDIQYLNARFSAVTKEATLINLALPFKATDKNNEYKNYDFAIMCKVVPADCCKKITIVSPMHKTAKIEEYFFYGVMINEELEDGTIPAFSIYLTFSQALLVMIVSQAILFGGIPDEKSINCTYQIHSDTDTFNKIHLNYSHEFIKAITILGIDSPKKDSARVLFEINNKDYPFLSSCKSDSTIFFIWITKHDPPNARHIIGFFNPLKTDVPKMIDDPKYKDKELYILTSPVEFKYLNERNHLITKTESVAFMRDNNYKIIEFNNKQHKVLIDDLLKIISTKKSHI
jgi:hypothetical protein